MKFHYEGHSLKPGIYKILNTHTNRTYIGQASRFKTRWYGHAFSLLTRKNASKFLLNDFSKCKLELGHDDFLEFHVLEVMEGSTKEERNLREEWWISQHYDNQGLCYNFKQTVDSKPRSPSSKIKTMSEAAKAKIGLAHRKLVSEHPEVLMPTQIGRAKWAQTHPERLKEIASMAGKASALKRALTITLASPKGQNVTITNVSEYARRNNLNPDNLMAVWKGKKGSYKGWTKPI